jgi:hypothetical protein
VEEFELGKWRLFCSCMRNCAESSEERRTRSTECCNPVVRFGTQWSKWGHCPDREMARDVATC